MKFESHSICNVLNCHCALFFDAVVAIFFVGIHSKEILKAWIEISSVSRHDVGDIDFALLVDSKFLRDKVHSVADCLYVDFSFLKYLLKGALYQLNA